MARGRVDWSTAAFAALALAAGATLLWRDGSEALWAAAGNAATLAAMVAPIVVAALLIAGYMQAIVPHELMQRWMGRDSGLRGLVLATAAGAVTPGGPFAAFPLVVGLLRAGASFQVAVAYLTAWTCIGLQRVLVWEIPLMGIEFVVVRLLASLPLPIVAGLVAGALADRLAALRRTPC